MVREGESVLLVGGRQRERFDGLPGEQWCLGESNVAGGAGGVGHRQVLD
jgi:hypothetical protein